MKIVNSRVTPPGSWQWRATDGQLIVSPTFDSFISKVHNWHVANNVEFDKAAFEDALCRDLGIEDTHCGEPAKLRPNTPGSPTLGDIKNFLKLLVARMAAAPEDRTVSPAEAERRASICRNCPMNRRVDGCMGCGGVLKLVKEAVGASATTSHDGALETCTVCHCFLRAKVWVGQDILNKVEAGLDREYPEHCWMRP